MIIYRVRHPHAYRARHARCIPPVPNSRLVIITHIIAIHNPPITAAPGIFIIPPSPQHLTIIERGISARRGRIATVGCCYGEDMIIANQVLIHFINDRLN